MGTAGPLRLASDILDDGSGEPFFVLNRWRTVFCPSSMQMHTSMSLCTQAWSLTLTASPTALHVSVSFAAEASCTITYPAVQLCLSCVCAGDVAIDSMLCNCSDVICNFPLKDMLAYHKKKGAEGTILVTKVHSSATACYNLRGCGLPKHSRHARLAVVDASLSQQWSMFFCGWIPGHHCS